MSFKPPILIIYTIIILIHLSTSTYSSPLIEQEDVPFMEQDVGPLDIGPLIEPDNVDPFIEQDADSVIIEHDDSPVEQDIGHFYCQNGTSLLCCPYLARQVASDNHSRGASIILVNRSGYNMTLKVVSLEDGRWITPEDYDGIIDINCEPQPEPLLNGSSVVYSSVTSHFLGGILGFTAFTMDDDLFTISWSVPTIGSPDYSVEGLSRNKYVVTRQLDSDDMVFRVIIDERIPFSFPFSLWAILSPFLLIPFGCICCICAGLENSSEVRLNSGVRNYGGTINRNIASDHDARNYGGGTVNRIIANNHGGTENRFFTNHHDASDLPRANAPAHMYRGASNPGFSAKR